MIDQKTVTSSSVVRVFTAPTIPTTTFRCRQVVVQNNGSEAVRCTLGGSQSATPDAPTTSRGLRILAGASMTISDPIPGAIDCIAESGSTTIDVVTD